MEIPALPRSLRGFRPTDLVHAAGRQRGEAIGQWLAAQAGGNVVSFPLRKGRWPLMARCPDSGAVRRAVPDDDLAEFHSGRSLRAAELWLADTPVPERPRRFLLAIAAAAPDDGYCGSIADAARDLAWPAATAEATATWLAGAGGLDVVPMGRGRSADLLLPATLLDRVAPATWVFGIAGRPAAVVAIDPADGPPRGAKPRRRGAL